jgi:hypothetical protein
MKGSVEGITPVRAVRDYRYGVQTTARPTAADTVRVDPIFRTPVLLECDATSHRF